MVNVCGRPLESCILKDVMGIPGGAPHTTGLSKFSRMTFPTEIGTIALDCRSTRTEFTGRWCGRMLSSRLSTPRSYGYTYGGMLHVQAEWLGERERLRRRPCEDLGR